MSYSYQQPYPNAYIDGTVPPPPPYYASTLPTVAYPLAQDYHQQPLTLQHACLHNPSHSDALVCRLHDNAIKYEICPDFRDRMINLRGVEVVIIADDSGSMTSMMKSGKTRWNELKEFIELVTDTVCCIDESGIDVYFLNRNGGNPATNVKSIEQVRGMFSSGPSGCTPLTRTLEKVYADKRGVIKEQGLLIILATDGVPTDLNGNEDIAGFRNNIDRVRKSFESNHNDGKRQGKVFITVRACTDQEGTLDYLDGWDKTYPRFDVVSDYVTERAQVVKAQGSKYNFSQGDYVVKVIMGSVDKWFDELDERKVSTKPQLLNKSNDGCCIIC
jgi:hypothetical protein